MIIGALDDFYPNAGTTKGDILSLSRGEGANSRRSDKAEREHG